MWDERNLVLFTYVYKTTAENTICVHVNTRKGLSEHIEHTCFLSCFTL